MSVFLLVLFLVGIVSSPSSVVKRKKLDFRGLEEGLFDLPTSYSSSDLYFAGSKDFYNIYP